MDKIILKIHKNLGRAAAYKFVEIVASSILEKLKLEKTVPIAAAFKFYSGETIDLEIRTQEIAELIVENRLAFSDREQEKLIDLTAQQLLSDLYSPIETTKLGKALFKSLSSAESEGKVTVEFLGDAFEIVIPKREPAQLSAYKIEGVYVIQVFRRTGDKCTLICTKQQRPMEAVMNCGEEARDMLLNCFSSKQYVHLRGVASMERNKIKKDSFVITECLDTFSDQQLDELIQTNKFDDLFRDDEVK